MDMRFRNKLSNMIYGSSVENADESKTTPADEKNKDASAK